MPGAKRRKWLVPPVAGRRGEVGLLGDELLQPGRGGRAVLADDGDGRLDFGNHAHVPQQLFRAVEVLAHRIEQRQAAFHVGIDVRLAVLDFGGVNEPAVDPVAQHRFHVERIGLDAERDGRIRRASAARQPGPARRTALAGCHLSAGKNRKKHSPSRSLRRTISCCRACHLLKRTNSSSTACTAPSSASSACGPFGAHRAVGMPAADDVGDAVFVTVYRELVFGGQRRH